MPDPGWVPVVLGDVRVGDTVRTLPNKVPEGSRFRNITGQIVGIRSGGVTVQVSEAWVNFWPDQLERQERPE